MRIGSQPLTPNSANGKAAGVAPSLEDGSAEQSLSRDGLSLSTTGKASHAAGEGDHPSLLERIVDKIESLFHHDDAPTPAPTPAPAPVTPAAPKPSAPKPNATAIEMRRNAEAIWFQPLALKDSTFRVGMDDAADVNVVDAALDRKATAQVAANAEAESAAAAKLTPEQAAQYQNLTTAMADRPQARLALQVLLVEGKLTGGSKNAGGDKLLSALDKSLASMPAQPISSASLVGDMIQEIAVPSAINQQNKTTCTVTSVQMLTAMENPAEYVRVVSGLASPSGNATLADGETVARKPGTEADDGSNRSTSSRLWQAAFSQFAVGPSVDFDNDRDARNDGKWGIFGPELDRVVDALTNRDNPLLSVGDDYTGEDLLRDVGQHANTGKPVPVCLDWGEANAAGDEHPGHDILVTKVANGQVYYNNPWGTQETMSTEEFAKRAWWANPIDMASVQPTA